jgi:hypothetical protein
MLNRYRHKRTPAPVRGDFFIKCKLLLLCRDPMLLISKTCYLHALIRRMSKHLIPPDTEFRQHLVTLCLLLMAYESLRLSEAVPDNGFNNFAPINKCVSFSTLIRKAQPSRNIPIAKEDVLFMYATCYLSSLLLLSQYDQLVLDYIFRNTPEYKSWGAITHFRQNMIDANTYLLKDTEQKYRKSGALQTLKRKLQACTIE